MKQPEFSSIQNIKTEKRSAAFAQIRSGFGMLLLMFPFFFQCTGANRGNDKQVNRKDMNTYTVQRSESVSHDINAVWDKEYWNHTPAMLLENHMGEKPVHFPLTRVKLRYDEKHIYVIFHVADRYVKAVAKETHGKVWLDSCVEFFFSPGPDTERGYFNFEANCKGVFLFQYHLNNREVNGAVSLEDCSKVEIAHSLQQNVEEEIEGPLDWIIEYSIPIAVLKKYMEVDDPGAGVKWRANFYKCADETSHPHWLTWAKVDYEKPKFHLPEFFGTIEFE